MYRDGPALVTVQLIVYERTSGVGTEADPFRTVRYLGLPDGTKVCRLGPDAKGHEDYQVFAHGFDRVFRSTESQGGEA